MIVSDGFRTRSKSVIGALLIVLATLAVAGANAEGVVSSDDYSLDYALVGAGAADAESVDDAYRIVSFVAVQGVANGIASSTSYETRPLVGVDITEVPVSLSAFCLE